jgi:hypothetical protein
MCLHLANSIIAGAGNSLSTQFCFNEDIFITVNNEFYEKE